MLDVKKNEDAFNAAAAAKSAGVSLPTMMAWLKRRDFPAFRSGRRWIIPREPFIEWLRKQAEERAEL